jgi:hypothetical protein
VPTTQSKAPRSATAKRDLAQAQATLTQLERQLIPLIRLSKDAGSTIRSSSGEKVHTSTISDPTGQQVINLVDGRQERDDVALWCNDLWHAYRTIIDQTQHVARLLNLIETRGEKLNQGRVPLGSDCEACGRYLSGAPGDERRSGLCDACRKDRDRDRKTTQDAGKDWSPSGWQSKRRAYLAGRQVVENAG